MTATAASDVAPASGAGHAAYRPHLDGIRAIAVVAVILFHLGYGWIPGGFVGVDVFFVLSGYLITGILLTEATDRGTIRLGRFYARRVRRLLPASIAVLAVVLFAGWHLLDPVQRSSLRWDATFAAGYSANWRFAFVGGDYFAPGDVPSPLVHYWSLAVEEQFYLVWPALVLLVHQVARRLRPARADDAIMATIVVLGVASTVASIVLVGDPVTYYGTHTRAYQLLAGAFLASAVRRWHLRFPDTTPGRAAAAAVTVGGLATLAWLAHTVADATRYPGWPGLWVTLASLAVIIGVDLVPAGVQVRAIGHPAMAAVGRLSYSLYIWHWPAIVLLPLLGRRLGGGWTHLGDTPVLTAIIVVAALVSYLVIERPIRFRLRPRTSPGPVVAVGLTCSLLVGAFAWWSFRPRNGFEQEALRAVRDLAEPGACPYFTEDWPSAADSHPCVFRQGTGPVIAIVGDSHAQQWQPAVEAIAEQNDATIIRATRGGCPANDVTPFLRRETGQVDVEDECTAWRRSVYPQVVERYHPDVILVATRSYVRGLRVDGADVYPNDPAHLRAWTAGWDWTLDTLTAGGATVALSETMPTMPQRVPACLIAHGKGHACDFAVADDQEVVPYNEAIRSFDGRNGGRVKVIDPVTIACPNGACPAIMDGEIVHRDDNHLSATFVRTHATAFATLLRSAGIPDL